MDMGNRQRDSSALDTGVKENPFDFMKWDHHLDKLRQDRQLGTDSELARCISVSPKQLSAYRMRRTGLGIGAQIRIRALLGEAWAQVALVELDICHYWTGTKKRYKGPERRKQKGIFTDRATRSDAHTVRHDDQAQTLP